MSLPRGVWTTSGWNCSPKMGRSRCAVAASGAFAVRAMGSNPGGGPRARAAWRLPPPAAPPPLAGAPPGEGRQRALAVQHLDGRRSELAVRGPVHPSTEHLGDQLKPVADAEHRHPDVEHARPGHRRALCLDRHRPTGQDDALWRERLDVLERQIRPVDLAVDAQLADPPGEGGWGVCLPESTRWRSRGT